MYWVSDVTSQWFSWLKWWWTTVWEKTGLYTCPCCYMPYSWVGVQTTPFCFLTWCVLRKSWLANLINKEILPIWQTWPKRLIRCSRCHLDVYTLTHTNKKPYTYFLCSKLSRFNILTLSSGCSLTHTPCLCVHVWESFFSGKEFGKRCINSDIQSVMRYYEILWDSSQFSAHISI